jgi:uncharacterized protein
MKIQLERWVRSLTLLSTVFSLPGAFYAQTGSTERAAPPPATLIQENDYTKLRIEANQLGEHELAALQAQARAGDLHAQLLLGMAYQLGCPGSTHDPAEALKWYQLAADQGSSIAANQIAVYYDPAERFGSARGHDPEQALSWYRKAAERGDDVVAQYNVGEMLHQMKRDAEAVDWYRKATENGVSLAAIGLVELYDQGKVLPGKSKHENWREAVEYFQRLADAGNPGAQYVLGQDYREGWLGVHRDLNRAFELFRQAAQKGWRRAILAVGDSYFKGMGVAKDRVEAAKWLQKAADQVDPIGLEYMAYIYEHGDGAPQDLVAAYSWYLLALRYGRRIEFHHKLTVAEMEEAEKRVRTFEIEHGIMDY